MTRLISENFVERWFKPIDSSCSASLEVGDGVGEVQNEKGSKSGYKRCMMVEQWALGSDKVEF